MPTYNYLCPNEECGLEEEKLFSIHDSPTVICPSCSAEMERTISGGAHFGVKGGKTPDRIQRAQEKKDAREVAEANQLVNQLSKTLRPKMKAAAEGRPLPSQSSPDKPAD
jgi:putative FmdB family regulatory protein